MKISFLRKKYAGEEREQEMFIMVGKTLKEL